MRILVIRFSALGDVAMLVPVLRQMAADNRNNEYIVLSKPIYEPLFDGVGENVSFIGADIKKDYKGLPGIYRLFKELKKLDFDYIIDEHDVLNEDGIIIVEVRKDTVLQEQYGSISLYKDKKYGINRLLYYRKDMKE